MKEIFYNFDGKFSRSVIRIQSEIEYDQLSVLSYDTPLLKSNKFSIISGKKEFDVIQFNDSFSIAISYRFKTILEENNVNGWSCFPIIIEGINQEYFAFQILAKVGNLLNREDINNGVTKFREFDINTWDGSDIFYLEDTLLKVCTPRVKEILELEKITNLEFCPF